MQSEHHTVFSDELRLGAEFHFPDDYEAEEKLPLVIPISGFTGVRRAHPQRFARALTRYGYACFSFDYRGFADSEGIRNRVLLHEQSRDVRAAAAYSSSDERIDSDRVFLLGWGVGSGMVIDATWALPKTRGLIAINGFYDGTRFQAAHRTPTELRNFIQLTWEARCERARTGQSHTVDPFEVHPLDDSSREYVEYFLKAIQGYDAQGYDLGLAESILGWNPGALASEFTLPILIAHAENNDLYPISEALWLYRNWGGQKELYRIPGVGHTEWMHDEDPNFLNLVDVLVDWLDRQGASKSQSFA